MEKRSQTRYEIGQSVVVTILSGEQSTHQATVRDGSGNGIALEMAVPVAIGAALKVQLNDCLLLGEAIHCSPHGDHFVVGILLDSRLSQLSSLARILEAFADREPEAAESPRRTPACCREQEENQGARPS